MNSLRLVSADSSMGSPHRTNVKNSQKSTLFLALDHKFICYYCECNIRLRLLITFPSVTNNSNVQPNTHILYHLPKWKKKTVQNDDLGSFTKNAIELRILLTVRLWWGGVGIFGVDVIRRHISVVCSFN